MTKNIDISKRIFLLSFGIFMLGLVGQLYVSNKLALKSKEMVSLDSQRTVLQRQLSELELEQSMYSSMSYIENKAFEMGFVKNTEALLTIKSSNTTAHVPSL
jgi:hypothetical protein